MTLLEAALAYAARGVPIFPCHPVEKYPLTPKDKDADGKPIPGTGGFYKATIDPIVIKRWWTQRPDAAIGMPTGRRSGIDVLDIDCKNGKDGFAALKTSGINWTELSPIRVHSRSAGGHGYFRANGVASSIALSGVDVQSDGRYVILPPSPGYVWVGLGLLDTSLDRLPGWPEALKGLSATKPNGVDKSERISGPPEAPIEDVVAALRVIKNEDLLWDEWNRIGMLVYRATDGMGLEEWEEWSAKSEKHDPEACEARWEHWTSSSPPTTGGAGTLFRLADEAAGGSHWRPSRSVAAREEFGDWAEEVIPEPAIKRLNWLDLAALDGKPLPVRQWTVKNRVPARRVGLFSGEGGTGKSLVELLRDGAHVLGREWFGAECKQGPVLYLGAEDDDDELHLRLGAVAEHYGVSFGELARCGLYAKSLWSEDATLCSLNQRTGKIEATALYAELLEQAGDLKPVNISLDTLSRVFIGNEIDRNHVHGFVQHMERLTMVSGGSVTVLSHPSLQGMSSGSGLSGSTAWHNAFRFRMYLRGTSASKDSDDGLRELAFMKNQYGPREDKIVLRYHAGLFLPALEPSLFEEAEMAAVVDQEFLDLLVKFAGQGRRVSHKLKSSTYAPALFASVNGTSRIELEAAMGRLFSRGKIRVEEYGYKSSRHEHIVVCPDVGSERHFQHTARENKGLAYAGSDLSDR